MKTQLKYTWDITTERNFSKKQMEMANMVSNTIARGGNVKDLRKALKSLSLL